jgi:hypothetical protein
MSVPKRFFEKIRRLLSILAKTLPARSLAGRVEQLKAFLLRTNRGRQPFSADAAAHDTSSRRQWLSSLGILPLVGLFAAPSSKKESEEKPDVVTGPTFVTRSDNLEYSWLKALNLDDPEVVAGAKKMPVGKIGDLTLGRLISGSNLISMNMHARDLDYVRALAANYNSEERIFMTLKRCEELGVNAIVLKNHNFKHFRLGNYWKEWGGRMKWLADVITTDIDQYERQLVEHLELGASSAYLWGGASDIWYHEGKQGNIVRAFEIMKKYDIPVGIGAHRLEPIAFCESEGLVPDYYIKTLHHDRYWSAHPKQNQRFIEMFEKNSPRHDEYHDNMFCHDHEETVEFMQDVKVPWIAFKIMAAGAIGPEDGFSYAFQSGADFVCVGMFDFQVQADVELTLKTVAGAQGRKRAWA